MRRYNYTNGYAYKRAIAAYGRQKRFALTEIGYYNTIGRNDEARSAAYMPRIILESFLYPNIHHQSMNFDSAKVQQCDNMYL